MEMLNSADFWIGLVKIIWINIILSGDNAVVIALAARSLPPEQQKKAIMFGSGAAVVLRANVPAAAASTLVTNPITFAPVYYAAYRVGARLTGADAEASPDLPVPLAGGADERSLWQRIGDVGTPLITGLAVFACSAGLSIYLLINLVWALVEQWRARKSRAP